MFDHTIVQNKDKILINLIGDLDIYSKEEMIKIIEDLKKYDKDLVFDLEKLEYIDSTGLGQFINVYKMVNEKERDVKIINAKPNIKKLFDITDLTKLFMMEQ
ncbi:MAG: STAS domain-containing protein [Tissierellia bacterium]|nr:STAS domain-containing protein [Tissierellia bacterium]